MMGTRIKIAMWLIASLVFVAGLFGLRVLQLNGAFEPKPSAPQAAPGNADPYLKTPLPDPDSDVLFGVDNGGMSIVRYSPGKGFWAREEQVSNSIGSGLHVDDGHYIFSVGGPFSNEIVSVDLQWARPWAAASVTPIQGVSHAAAFDAVRHRYFILTPGKVSVYQVHGPNFKQINTVGVNVNADVIAADGSGRFLFTCPGQGAASCREFDIDAQTGELSPEGGRELAFSSAVHRLFSTPDGRFLVVPDEKFGVHRPPEYKLNAQLKYSPVPGTGQEIPDVGFLRIYRLASGGGIAPVPGSPFRTQHVPWSVTLSPNGHFVYVGYQLTGAVVGQGLDAYSLNPKSGALKFLPDAITLTHGGAQENPQTLIFGQSQGRAFGDTRNAQLIAYDADPQTGHLTPRAKTFLWPHLAWVLSAPEHPAQNH